MALSYNDESSYSLVFRNKSGIGKYIGLRDLAHANLIRKGVEKVKDKMLPDATDLLEPLENFHSVLYDAFGHSIARTREALSKTYNKKSTRMFRPHAIRFYVHDFLSHKGIRAQLVDENDKADDIEELFAPKVLSNNGIAGIIHGYPFRILKIYNGGLPPPVTHGVIGDDFRPRARWIGSSR